MEAHRPDRVFVSSCRGQTIGLRVVSVVTNANLFLKVVALLALSYLTIVANFASSSGVWLSGKASAEGVDAKEPVSE